MSENKFRVVNQPVRKKDAMQLLLGGPAYVDDVTPHDCLVVKVLRSPHAHALIEEISTDIAMKVPGIECVFTYKDVPQKRFTMAGQTFPEPSPYDRLILDQRVRFVGDAVAIVAGESEKAVDKALKLIKVKYQVLEPVLDIHTAATCARATPAATATWTRCWRTATRSSITFTTPRPASRR